MCGLFSIIVSQNFLRYILESWRFCHYILGNKSVPNGLKWTNIFSLCEKLEKRWILTLNSCNSLGVLVIISLGNEIAPVRVSTNLFADILYSWEVFDNIWSLPVTLCVANSTKNKGIVALLSIQAVLKFLNISAVNRFVLTNYEHFHCHDCNYEAKPLISQLSFLTILPALKHIIINFLITVREDFTEKYQTEVFWCRPSPWDEVCTKWPRSEISQWRPKKRG